MRKELSALSLAFPAMIMSTEAFGQNARNCGAREQVVTRLAERYGETRQSMGLGANNSVFEMFASEETGTWTILLTLPNGMACLMASGQAYEELTEELKPTSQML